MLQTLQFMYIIITYKPEVCLETDLRVTKAKVMGSTHFYCSLLNRILSNKLVWQITY